MQIVAGTEHVGDLGAVVHADRGVAEVLLDTTDSAVRVLVNNLAETAETRTSRQALGRFALHSLVQLTDGEVGMLLHIGADAAQLLMSSALPFCLALWWAAPALLHAACRALSGASSA